MIAVTLLLLLVSTVAVTRVESTVARSYYSSWATSKLVNDVGGGARGGTPCYERSKMYRLPDGCRCRVDRDNGTEVNCDGVVFVGDFPLLPFRHRIHSFRQRGVGHQTLAAQIFTASDVPLKRVDFSDNELARLVLFLDFMKFMIKEKVSLQPCLNV
jgi:hypothetical protein